MIDPVIVTKDKHVGNGYSEYGINYLMATTALDVTFCKAKHCFKILQR